MAQRLTRVLEELNNYIVLSNFRSAVAAECNSCFERCATARAKSRFGFFLLGWGRVGFNNIFGYRFNNTLIGWCLDRCLGGNV